MIGHLIESTLFLAAAILVAQIPRLAARTRYTVVFAALMKFAIPSAIVPRILAVIGIDLARLPKGTIIIEALGPLVATSPTSNAATRWPMIAMAVWLAVAATLLARALIRGRTTLRRALANGRNADAGEITVLDHARARARIARPLRLVISPSMAAPVTAGILRPIIIVPAATPLTDPELETILTHECAHVARRDNLLSLIETVAGCALWFHPLVWVARRVLDGAREEACDAIVIASGDAGVYVTALGKVCNAALGPRVAAVSCIVSNTIHERMEAIMRFGERRLLNHRAVAATAIAVLAMATLGIGVARAIQRGEKKAESSAYKVDVSAKRDSDSNFIFDLVILDRQSGDLTTMNFRVRPNKAYSQVSGNVDKNGKEHERVIHAMGHDDGSATVELTIDHGAPIILAMVAKPSKATTTGSTEGISVDLKDADIRDLLKTFSQLANTAIVVDDDVSGHVTVQMTDIPWTKALDIVLRQNNLRSERIGDTIYVHRE
jgi:Antirepressor regulating drug resistance, predicted signal transduction N-terminal membrane component